MMRAVISTAFLIAAPGHAQGLATSALRGHDANAPVTFDAQRLEVLDAQNQAIATGDVRVEQGDMRLRADRIRLTYTRAKDSDPVVRRMDAEGNVRLTTPSESATGRYGIYDVDRRILTMVGNVVLSRSQSVLRGNRLSIDLNSGKSSLDGGSSLNVPGATSSGGRVTGRFAVPQSRR